MAKAIKKKKTNYGSPAGPDVAEKHRTSGARTPGPHNSNPPIFQSPGDRTKRAQPPCQELRLRHRQPLTWKNPQARFVQY